MFMIDCYVVYIPDVLDGLFRYGYISILRDDFFSEENKNSASDQQFSIYKIEIG